MQLSCPTVKNQMKQNELADRTPGWLVYEPVGNTEIQALLQRALDKAAGVKQDVAKAMGITPSRFAKLYSQIRGREAPNVANCFRLAEFLGESPDVVLRAAGQGDVAALIPKHYGAIRKPKPAVRARQPSKLAVALDEALAKGANPQNAAALVNTLRETVGLPDVSLGHGRSRAALQ